MANICASTGLYTPHNIRFTADNVEHILSGGCCMISPDQVGKGHHTVHLTRRQKAAVEKGMHTGGNIKLHKFSRAQLRHNMKHGGSFLSSLASAAKKLIAHPAVNKLVSKHAHAAVSKVANKLHHLAPAAIGKVAARAGKYIGHANAAKLAKLGQEHVHKGIARAHDKAHTVLTESGVGLKKRRGGAVAARGKLWPARQGGFGLKKKGGYIIPNTYNHGKQAVVNTGRYNLVQSGW